MNVWLPIVVQVSANLQFSGLHNCCIFIGTDEIYPTALFLRIVHQGCVKKHTDNLSAVKNITKHR